MRLNAIEREMKINKVGERESEGLTDHLKKERDRQRNICRRLDRLKKKTRTPEKRSVGYVYIYIERERERRINRIARESD